MDSTKSEPPPVESEKPVKDRNSILSSSSSFHSAISSFTKNEISGNRFTEPAKKLMSPSTKSAAIGFFTFKWLFKRKSSTVTMSKQQTASSISGSQSLNHPGSQSTQQPKETATLKPEFPRLTKENCMTRTPRFGSNLKASYSFDDIDEYFDRKNGENDSGRTKLIDKSKKSLTRSSQFDLLSKSNQQSGREFAVTEKNIEKICCLCLCQVKRRQMHTIWSCGCSFCVECLKIYLTINIRENNNVPFLSCPDTSCPLNGGPRNARAKNHITPQEVELLVDQATFSLYKKFKRDWEIEQDPNRTWCPSPNCDNICLITHSTLASLATPNSFSSTVTTSTDVNDQFGDGDHKLSSFYCNKCEKRFCTKCRSMYHRDRPCKNVGENSLLLFGGHPNGSNLLEIEIKKCPRCLAWIERDDGCAQMMCRKCKHVFCWFCLQSLEDDVMLRHYDKGPCKNKLGHSRVSVIWHRTQVIGIFFSFGVLLLLASPLFILAAPCILCCSCCKTSCKLRETASKAYSDTSESDSE